jgi:hypothetical protein
MEGWVVAAGGRSDTYVESKLFCLLMLTANTATKSRTKKAKDVPIIPFRGELPLLRNIVTRLTIF